MVIILSCEYLLSKDKENLKWNRNRRKEVCIDQGRSKYRNTGHNFHLFVRALIHELMSKWMKWALWIWMN